MMVKNKSDGQAETRPVQPEQIEKKGGYSPSEVTDLSEVKNPKSGPAPGATPKAEASADTSKKS